MRSLNVMAVLPNLLEATVLAVGITLISSRLRGRPRSLGLAGCVVLLVLAIFNTVFNLALPSLYSDLGSP